ncbi:APC family permease [Nonomuraea sp. NN258]|uniref:APC family permease n=1 Tax=Nonomuraea antri TaxID=2730852 RepID=UPI001569F044|nr:APC family permease [Nonomuraea antri]NRQ32842.1 APC family permease [Nonomuraea antri]
MQPQETIEQFGYRQELRRGVGFVDLVFYGLMFMVPIAPFAIFGMVYSKSGGMPALAYLVGVVAMLFTAASYAQMVKAFPLSGSVYNYAGRGIAPPVGFLTGWAILLDYILVPCLLYLIASIAMNAIAPGIPVLGWLVVFVVINTVINLRGIKMTVQLTKIMIVAELVVLVLFLLVGVWALASGKGQGFNLNALFNPDTFSWPLIFGAVSIAVLSFLGFDGISMLAEESSGGSAEVGRAMRIALVLAAVLFVTQVWVAALLVPDPAMIARAGDTAFYEVAAYAGGDWLRHVTTAATAVSWGVGNTMVAQVSVSRLLYAMARDRQLPSFLARVSVKRSVPTNATLLVAATSIAIGGWMSLREDGAGLLTSLVNMGALISFAVLHLSVIVHYLIRGRSSNLWAHLLAPLIGMAVLVFVVFYSDFNAQLVMMVWLGLGLVVLGVLYALGRRPTLPYPVAAEK